MEVGLARKSDAETTRFEAHFDRAYHERVRAGYLALAAAEPTAGSIVDASAPQEDVLAAARATILDFLDRVARRGLSRRVAAHGPAAAAMPSRAPPGLTGQSALTVSRREPPRWPRAGRARALERGEGRRQQLVGAGAVGREAGDARRDGDGDAVDRRQRVDGPQDPVRHDDAAAPRGDDDELVAADAGDGVHQAHLLGEHGRDGPQDVVADRALRRAR